MAKFMLCWEMGAGLGHVGRLKPIAQTLRARGHECALLLRDLVQSDGLLGDLPAPRLQAPVWLHQVVRLPDPLVSLPEILLGQGYLQPGPLAALVRGWLELFRLVRPQAVIGDYAPTAVLAARIAGLPSATVGLGFYMPPDAAPLPSFLPAGAASAERIRQAEARALSSVNQVLRHFDKPALDRMAPLFTGDLPLLCTWPELDHYGRQNLPAGQSFMGPSFMTQGGAPAEWPAEDGPKVFAYLKAGHPDHQATLRALVTAGCRTLCYMPEVAAGRPRPVSSPLIRYAAAPVDIAEAMRDCALMVCHAGEATVVQGLLAGVPVLMLPMHREQALMAAQVARTGAAIDANNLRSPSLLAKAIQRLLHEPAFRERARDFARRHADFRQQRQIESLADAFESLLR